MGSSPIKFDYYGKTRHRAKPAPCKVFFSGNNDGILHQCDRARFMNLVTGVAIPVQPLFRCARELSPARLLLKRML